MANAEVRVNPLCITLGVQLGENRYTVARAAQKETDRPGEAICRAILLLTSAIKIDCPFETQCGVHAGTLGTNGRQVPEVEVGCSQVTCPFDEYLSDLSCGDYVIDQNLKGPSKIHN